MKVRTKQIYQNEAGGILTNDNFVKSLVLYHYVLDQGPS